MKKFYSHISMALLMSCIFLNGNANAGCGFLRLQYTSDVNGWIATGYYTTCEGERSTFRAWDPINTIRYLQGDSIEIGPMGSTSSPLVITKEQTAQNDHLYVCVSGILANPKFVQGQCPHGK